MARKKAAKQSAQNARGKRAKKAGKSVASIRHKDKRKNIPTEELRDFVAKDEASPKTMLYPRDPSLDPQLVWKGKDEQDREDLAVPVVPVYIQEKIHPHALIEDLRRTAKAGAESEQPDLFADFNGIEDFDKQVDFYHHDANWSNRMILGDSLLVMTSLAEKEGLKGKVQTIYIDPPYGIKFASNWQVSTRKRDVKDGRAGDATRQPEQIRAFRDTWKLGIHSYLAYLRDRLVVARELLTETGSCFVQIGDENVHLVRCLMDEVFGTENFCSLIAFRTTGGQSSSIVSSSTDYLLWYAKCGRESGQLRVKYRQLMSEKTGGSQDASGQYTLIEPVDGGEKPSPMPADMKADEIPAGYRCLAHDTLYSQGDPGDPEEKAFTWQGRTFQCPRNTHWKASVSGGGMDKLSLADRLMLLGNTLRYKRYVDDHPVYALDNVWNDTAISGFGRKKAYVVETSTKVVERCLLMTTDPGDLVLDPTCGSGTTAYVAEQWGRRWITIDTSRVALALARTRLMSAKYPYYLLADSPEGVQKEAESTQRVPPEHETGHDIRKGFVYKRVPHVTLKSIANNLDIKEGMTREEIDAAIARHAEHELLYDQPYGDNSRIRVSGPLSVESLSPHRVLSPDEERPASEREGQQDSSGDFVSMILENLKKAGVQNMRKAERLKFDRLEAHAGTSLHAAGEYTDADGKVNRVAVSIGPEHGTVGKEHIKEAAKEAVQGVGFDLLIVCGFAFDAHASEAAKEFSPGPGDASIVAEGTTSYGKLPVMLARMNPDLAMGDELLKKTGAGNLFTVFGEPDVDIRKDGDGKLVVEIKGVDVYDPTTGQIRNSSVDDIACWFIDTDYNGESFFVRRAYFTGAGEPYDKLKRALRADIDEAAWATLYSTTSRPFDPPTTGKIALKVINHYGDEVLKVFEV